MLEESWKDWPRQMVDSAKRLIRYRATSIVVRDDGILLLIRRLRETEFGLPGGGIENGELPISSAARDLYEETGLIASELKYISDYCDFWAGEIRYWGQVHSVFRVDAGGEVQAGDEHSEFAWWNGDSNLPLRDNVRPICVPFLGVSE